MATSSFTDRVVISDKKAQKTLIKVLGSESPCKDVKPVSEAEIQKGKEFAKKWQSQFH